MVCRSAALRPADTHSDAPSASVWPVLLYTSSWKGSGATPTSNLASCLIAGHEDDIAVSTWHLPLENIGTASSPRPKMCR